MRDHRPGVPRPDRHRIFEPFQRVVDRLSPGLGLGLAICKALAELHGGALSVEYPADGGTRLVLRLPVQETEAH